MFFKIPNNLTKIKFYFKMKLNFNFKINFMKIYELKKILSSEGLKSTKQRQDILNVFYNLEGHKNISQIYNQVSKINPRIGFSTVYRTLKLLTRLGLVVQRKFADGETRYELVSNGTHHDHLICVECGKIIEFHDKTLESLQNKIAKRYLFKTFYHRMELYGICTNCAEKK